MPSRVTPISSRLHSDKFGKQYPRYVRTITLGPANEKDVETHTFTPIPPGYEVYSADAPMGDSKRVIDDLNAQEQLTNFNHILLYRLLSLLYGDPDVVTACVSEDKTVAYPVDWSYSIVVNEDLICEIRNKFTTRVYLCFWAPKLQLAEKKSRIHADIVTLLESLNESIDQNLHLWDESKDLPGVDAYKALSNVPAMKYRGAERLFEIAQDFDTRPKLKTLKPGEKQTIQPVGYLYTASAIQFFVALESFVTLLFELLLRPDFRQRTYERLTIRGEIDLRLVSMHIFCAGFDSQPIKPGSELWNQIIELRDLRNDLVHGNITEEHRVYSIMEAGFLFFYAPSTDFRGRKLEAKPARAFPRDQTQITKKTVMSIKEITDRVRESILSAMDIETRTWAESWLWNSVIHPRSRDA